MSGYIKPQKSETVFFLVHVTVKWNLILTEHMTHGTFTLTHLITQVPYVRGPT